MAIKTIKKRSTRARQAADKFFERDHSKDPYVWRKLEQAKKDLANSNILELLRKHEK